MMLAEIGMRRLIRGFEVLGAAVASTSLSPGPPRRCKAKEVNRQRQASLVDFSQAPSTYEDVEHTA